jgi:predicted nucleic acid-binding protein
MALRLGLMVADGASAVAVFLLASLVRFGDGEDDYIVALAREQRATIVSGDADLLALKKTTPVPILRSPGPPFVGDRVYAMFFGG